MLWKKKTMKKQKQNKKKRYFTKKLEKSRALSTLRFFHFFLISFFTLFFRNMNKEKAPFFMKNSSEILFKIHLYTHCSVQTLHEYFRIFLICIRSNYLILNDNWPIFITCRLDEPHWYRLKNFKFRWEFSGKFHVPLIGTIWSQNGWRIECRHFE